VTGFERRLAALEAAVAPEPQSAYDRFVEKHPEIEWMTCDELLELEEIYRACDDNMDQMPPASQAKAMSLWYAAEARMLAGEPKDCDIPYKYDIQASYERSQREHKAKLARERNGDGR
jgi:hypothetical protein